MEAFDVNDDLNIEMFRKRFEENKVYTAIPAEVPLLLNALFRAANAAEHLESSKVIMKKIGEVMAWSMPVSKVQRVAELEFEGAKVRVPVRQ